MTDPIAAADAYHTGLVPSLMQEWAPRLVEAARILPGHTVLDIACGTGVLTREAARRAGSTGKAVGLDIDRGMLAIARQLNPALEWHEGSAESLPFPDQSFDAVVSQFGLMFVRNKSRALSEMWRVVKPGGRMAVAVWASLEETPAYLAETELIERHGGSAVSAPLRTPFNLGDRRLFGALFDEAAIPLESLSTVIGSGHFSSIREMVGADVIGWLPVMGVTLSSESVDRILDEAESVLAPYRLADGSVRFASPAHIAVSLRTPVPASTL